MQLAAHYGAFSCTRALVCLIGLLSVGVNARATDRQIQVGWSALADQVVGRNISTMLTDGVQLQGKGIAIKSGALVMDVKKTSAPAKYSGQAEVPRELVTVIRVSRPGWKWRVIGPIVGFIGLGVAGARIGDSVDPSGFIISDGAAHGATVGAITGAGLGYVIGYFADRHHTVVQILP